MIAVEVRVQNAKHFFTEALEHLRIAHEFANNVQGMDALEDAASGFVRELNDYRQVIKAHRDLMEGGMARETIRAAAKETRRIAPAAPKLPSEGGTPNIIIDEYASWPDGKIAGALGLTDGPATSPVTDPLFKSIHQETA